MCPAGSYDVNVEPAKDDVLFEDPNRFLLALESFFISFYGELPAVGGNKNRAPKQLIGTRNWRTDFELLLAKRPKSTENPSSPEINIPEIQIGADEDNRDLHRTQSLVDLDENHEQAGLLPDPKDLAIDTISNSHVESYNQNCPNTGSHEPSPGDDSISDDDHPRKRRHTWRFNMYGCDEEDSDDPRGTQESPIDDDADTEEALRDINVSNPWIIAKMNAPVHPKPTTQTGDNNDVDGNNQLMTPTRDAVQYASSTVVTKLHTAQRLSENTAPYLPTPQRTLPSSTRYVENSSPPNSWHFPSKAWAKAPPESDGGRKLDQARDRHIIGALDRWVQKSAISGQRDLTVNDEEPFHGSSEDGNGTDNATRQQSPNHTNDFISARALQQQGTPLSQIPEAPPRRTPRYSPRKPPQQGSINKLFVSPVNDPHRVWFEIESSNRRTKPSTQARSKSVRDAITATTPISFPSEDEDPMDDPSPLSPTAPATNPNGLTLEKLMDYEHRKHAATQAYKASLLKQSILTSSSHPTDHHPSANSPHRARYEAAKAALAPPNPNDTDNVPQSVFADSDPRAYLLRVLRREDAAQRQGASAGQRPRRAKTSMLPLETIAADEKVQDLVLTIATDSRTIRKLEKSASTTDAYVCSGAMTSGLQAMIDDIRTWEQNLSALILHTFTTEGGEEAKMSFDLWPPLQAHMATHTHD